MTFLTRLEGLMKLVKMLVYMTLHRTSDPWIIQQLHAVVKKQKMKNYVKLQYVLHNVAAAIALIPLFQVKVVVSFAAVLHINELTAQQDKGIATNVDVKFILPKSVFSDHENFLDQLWLQLMTSKMRRLKWLR